MKAWVFFASIYCPALAASRLSDERIVFQTKFGSIELALYPEVCLSWVDKGNWFVLSPLFVKQTVWEEPDGV